MLDPKITEQAEQAMQRINLSLARALAPKITARTLADALHPLPDHLSKGCGHEH